MSKKVENLADFVSYVSILKGDEKGEAQVFCDRLFKAFGHEGYKEAGAELEYRIKKHSQKGISFADLIWKPRMLLEMKKKGEKLYKHYQQAFEYWIHAVPNRPRYMVLCNFEEFWIYDFDKQIDEPVDIIKVTDLPQRYTALNFLFPDDPKPIFGNDREAVSREAAKKLADLFQSLVNRGVDREKSQRFILQCLVAMFSEDIDLLPSGTIHNLSLECIENNQSSYDVFGGLFRQMNSKVPAYAGKYKDIPYFNGGLFSIVDPIELSQKELLLLGGEEESACFKDWSKVNPAIFGTLFQQSMDKDTRHALGAHFTSEADIQRIVRPTIIRPWKKKIESATSLKELLDLRKSLTEFNVLDPACGSGNFLYIAYRELVRLEIFLLSKIKSNFSESQFNKHLKTISLVSPKQMYGIDLDHFAVELAKVTLMIAKKLAIDEAYDALEREQIELELGQSESLPLDNLDDNILNMDALLEEWPKCDAIIGNPPYQSKNKIQSELGSSYLNKIRSKYPDVDGRADYCVYWFRKAHDELRPEQHAGLVGTNTIRQNYSRKGGLDYIVANNGTIEEAVTSMKWSGDAVVYVSIVNWVKGESQGLKRLFIQENDNDPSKDWRFKEIERIGPSLSFETDVSDAKTIYENTKQGLCYQGQTHGHKGFLMSEKEGKDLILKNPSNSEVLFPFMIAEDLLGKSNAQPSRYVIDFSGKDILEAQKFKPVYDRVKDMVLPAREAAAQKEASRNKDALNENPKAKVNWHHRNFLEKWWLLSYARNELIRSINSCSRYIVCGRVTKRPIFEFVSSSIHPNDALMVFPLEDDYSFGILQSSVHWTWFINRCSTLKGDPRYTSNTVFDSFPWPQTVTEKQVAKIANAAVQLRTVRRELMEKHKLTLRDLYRSVDGPGSHPMKDAQEALDAAVRNAYGFNASDDILALLLELNDELSAKESEGIPPLGPGLPKHVKSKDTYISCDSITMMNGISS